MSLLLEREFAAHLLNDALLTARQGQGSLVLISGEAGLGKSSVVESFATKLPSSAPIIWGACDSLFTPRPWGPLHDIARQVDNDLGSLLITGDDRRAIFDRSLALLRASRIIIIEDIHWADESTLDLLKYLGRRIHRCQALLLVTFRDDEVGPQHPLRLLLGDLATASGVKRLTLEPLSVEAVALMAGQDVAEAAELHRLTGGNPFFVQAVLGNDGDGIPVSIRDAILARLARLSLSGRAVIDAAAVIGSRVEPLLLTDVTGAEAQAVDESLALGLLLAKGSALTFRHELVRQTVLEAIAPHRAMFLHRATLEGLERLPLAGVDAARLVGHAVPAGDTNAILTYSRKAAKAAEDAGMHRSCVQLLELALQYVDELSLPEQVELYRKFGLSARDEPGLGRSIQAWQTGVAKAREHGEPVLVASIMTQLANGFLITDQHDRALPLLEESLRLLAPFEAIDEIAAINRSIAYSYLLFGEPDLALAAADKSYQASLKSSSIIIRLRGLQIWGLCLMTADLEVALATLREGHALAREANVPHGMELFSPNLAMCLMDVYRLDEAQAVLELDYEFASKRQVSHTLSMIESWQTAIYFYRGDWERCWQEGQQFITEQSLKAGERSAGANMMIRLLARQGEISRAQALLERLYYATDRIGTVIRRGVIVCIATEVAWLTNDMKRMWSEIDGFWQKAVHNRQQGFAAELAYWASKGGRKLPTYDWMFAPFVLQVEGRWREAAEIWRELGCPYEQARALAEGDAQGQKEALIILERLGARPLIEATRASLRAAGIQAIPRRPRKSTRNNPFGLTGRQVEILALLIEQLTNAEIGARLHISVKTVDHHVSAILGKLQVPSREAAAAEARKHPHFQ